MLASSASMSRRKVQHDPSGMSRRAAAVAGLALAMLGCNRPVSDGSRLEGPQQWMFSGAQAATSGQWIATGDRLADDVISVTLMAHGPVGGRLAVDISDDRDRILVSGPDSESSPNRMLGTRVGLLSGTIPSSSAGLPLAQNYRVSSTAGDPLEISVWTKHGLPGHRVPPRQELPVVVFLVGDSRQDGVALAVALGEAGRIWRAAGIEILEPARLRVAGEEGARRKWLALVPSQGSDSPQLGALLQLSMGASSDALSGGVPLPIFLVEGIDSGAGSGVVAVSGGIPVPPVLGTIRSGIALNATLVAREPVVAGQILAHEIGHALGLFHTTEGPLQRGSSGASAVIIDQLDDTAACPATADTDDDGFLSGSECEAADAGNLMFWSPVRGGTHLTAGQADIARRSALVR